MKTYKESKLENGLAILTSEDPNAEIVTISVWARAGSRYEKADERGYAHILEHMLLKGSKKRPSIFDVNVVMDRAGAMSNASTSMERVQVYIEVAKERLDDMFELLADIIKNPLMDEATLENEKKVILQEYDRSYDTPANRLWIESSKRIFEGHPLSNNALGTKESIIAATTEALKGYRERMFIPQRMAVVVAGGASHEKIVKISRMYFGGMTMGNSKEADNFSTPIVRQGGAFEMMPTAQTQVNFNFLSPAVSLRESAAMDIYATFLGYKHTSLLYQDLRHKLGLVYNIGVSYRQYSDAGLLYIATSTTKPQEVIALVIDRVIHASKYFTKELFEIYREQLINIVTRETSGASGGIGYLGGSWLHFGKLVTPDEWKDVIREIEYEEIMKMISRLVTKDNLFIMAVGEKEFPIEF